MQGGVGGGEQLVVWGMRGGWQLGGGWVATGGVCQWQLVGEGGD